MPVWFDIKWTESSSKTVEERSIATENLGQVNKEERKEKMTYADIVQKQVSGKIKEAEKQQGMSNRNTH